MELCLPLLIHLPAFLFRCICWFILVVPGRSTIYLRLFTFCGMCYGGGGLFLTLPWCAISVHPLHLFRPYNLLISPLRRSDLIYLFSFALLRRCIVPDIPFLFLCWIVDVDYAWPWLHYSHCVIIGLGILMSPCPLYSIHYWPSIVTIEEYLVAVACVGEADIDLPFVLASWLLCCCCICTLLRYRYAVVGSPDLVDLFFLIFPTGLFDTRYSITVILIVWARLGRLLIMPLQACRWSLIVAFTADYCSFVVRWRYHWVITATVIPCSVVLSFDCCWFGDLRFRCLFCSAVVPCLPFYRSYPLLIASIVDSDMYSYWKLPSHSIWFCWLIPDPLPFVVVVDCAYIVIRYSIPGRYNRWLLQLFVLLCAEYIVLFCGAGGRYLVGLR